MYIHIPLCFDSYNSHNICMLFYCEGTKVLLSVINELGKSIVCPLKINFTTPQLH